MKPFAESAEQNKEPLLEVLREVFANARQVLEVGSGTGQHAVYFSRELPHLTWQPSDVLPYLAGIHAWREEAQLLNLRAPIALDVRDAWPEEMFDAVFSANTAHIMSWASVEQMFAGIGRVLGAQGVFALYGPFNYGGDYTSDSNARFDAWLKARDPHSGVRDFEALDHLAQQHGLQLQQDYAMPANNRTLVWRKGG